MSSLKIEEEEEEPVAASTEGMETSRRMKQSEEDVEDDHVGLGRNTLILAPVEEERARNTG